MKKLLYTIFAILMGVSSGFAARSAVNTMTNFVLNTSTNTYSFDIYSRSTGTTSIPVGLTSFYVNCNYAALGSPVLTYINPNYTGVPDGSTTDYKTMTVQVVNHKVAVTIFFTGNGTGNGTQLSSALPMGELICSISLSVLNQNALSNVTWDNVNSAMVTTAFAAVAGTFDGNDASPLPVELKSFTAFQSGSKVMLKWRTESEVRNSGFELERKSANTDWKKITFVAGAGNSNVPKEYSYKDFPSGNKEFQYRLKQIDVDGSTVYSPVVEVSLAIPAKFNLDQNYPNPFNPTTNVRFELPADSRVNLKIYNMLGQQVAELINQDYPAGYHSVVFDASNLASGTYIYRLEAGSFSEIKKMMLIK